MTVAEFLKRLDGVRSTGTHQWQARCPAHEDRVSSLSLSEGDDGKILLHDHAGCSTEAILGALGLKLADLFPPKNEPRRIVEAYAYRDERGDVLFEVVRMEPKSFPQRRPDGRGGWLWKLGDTRRVLYRLPELLATDTSATVYIVEGEKDVHALEALGLLATTSPQGAGKWAAVADHARQVLRDRPIAILPDADAPGRDHALDVARALHDVAASIRIVDLPGVPEKGDVSDWIANGGIRAELEALAAWTPEWTPASSTAKAPTSKVDGVDDVDDESPGEKPARRSIATRLLGLAEGAEYFHAPDGKGFVTFKVAGHQETHPIRSRAMRSWLRRLLHEAEKIAAPGQAIIDACEVLESRALFDGQEHHVHLRVAHHDGELFLDLGDPRWRVIRIATEGWAIVDHSPAKFRRSLGMEALPDPVSGGSVDLLRPLINVRDEDWPLLAGWLIGTLAPSGPYAILLVRSEQGSGKSSATKMMRNIIDPNVAGLRGEPKDVSALVVAANNSHVLSFDNLSHVGPGLADALCRIASGSAFGARQLYTDDEEILFSFQRPMIINAITDVTNRADLLDRAVLVELPRIDEAKRRPERVLLRAFEDVRPMVLGALLDAASTALRELPGIDLPRAPRMHDFAAWGVAGEQALGLAPGVFLAAYETNRAASADVTLDNPVAQRLCELAEAKRRIEATAAELLAVLQEGVSEALRRSQDWPTSPRQLSGILRRLAPSLRSVGVVVEFARQARRDRRRIITVALATQESARDPSSTPSTSSNSTAMDGVVVDGVDGSHPDLSSWEVL